MSNNKLNIVIISDSIRQSNEMIRDMVLPISETVANLCNSRDYDKILEFLKNSSITVCSTYCKETVGSTLSKMLHMRFVKTNDIVETIEVLNKCKHSLLLIDNSSNLTEINELVKKFDTSNTHFVYNYSIETGNFEVVS